MRSEIGYVSYSDDLQPGDILICRSPQTTTFRQDGIMFAQALVSQSQGHYDSTHVAICIQRDRCMIAHLTGHDVMGYKTEPLADMIKRDGNDRAFIVFRAGNKAVANKIAQVAASDENKDIKWVIPSALRAFLTEAQLDPMRKYSTKEKAAKKSFCSRFGIEVLKVALSDEAIELKRAFYPNIRSVSTPKAFEGWLYNNKNYLMLVHPGKENPYEVMQGVINTQISRVGERQDLRSRNKHKALETKLEAIVSLLEETDINALKKTFLLLQAMIPVLAINTKYGIYASTSQQNFKKAADVHRLWALSNYGVNISTSLSEVMGKARSMGIFMRDIIAIEACAAPLLFSSGDDAKQVTVSLPSTDGVDKATIVRADDIIVTGGVDEVKTSGSDDFIVMGSQDAKVVNFGSSLNIGVRPKIVDFGVSTPTLWHLPNKAGQKSLISEAKNAQEQVPTSGTPAELKRAESPIAESPIHATPELQQGDQMTPIPLPDPDQLPQESASISNAALIAGIGAIASSSLSSAARNQPSNVEGEDVRKSVAVKVSSS